MSDDLFLKAAGIIIFLITFPGTLELSLLTLGALLPSKKKVPAFKSPVPPKIAVIVPAHNEEKGIIRTLKSLKACPDPFTLPVMPQLYNSTAETYIGCG